jgi:hypothetical protein
MSSPSETALRLRRELSRAAQRGVGGVAGDGEGGCARVGGAVRRDHLRRAAACIVLPRDADMRLRNVGSTAGGAAIRRAFPGNRAQPCYSTVPPNLIANLNHFTRNGVNDNVKPFDGGKICERSPPYHGAVATRRSAIQHKQDADGLKLHITLSSVLQADVESILAVQRKIVESKGCTLPQRILWLLLYLERATPFSIARYNERHKVLAR